MIQTGLNKDKHYLCMQNCNHTHVNKSPTETRVKIYLALSYLCANIGNSPAGTVQSHSNVISVFKRAVFTASLHLTNILSDAIIVVIRNSLCHIIQELEAVKIARNSGLAVNMTLRFQSQNH